MKYAIVLLQGKQFRVSEGDEFPIDRLTTEEQKSLEIAEVLFVSSGTKAKIGSPYVKGAKVVLTNLKNSRGDKLRVATFKAKSRYRRTVGHRQDLSLVRVDSIEF